VKIFLSRAGVVWCILGAVALMVANGALHQILGCLALSLGVMFWGMAEIIEQLRKLTTTRNP
jgi:hypothetical protein